MENLIWASILMTVVKSNPESKHAAPKASITEIETEQATKAPEYSEDVSYFFKDDADPVLKPYYEPHTYSL